MPGIVPQLLSKSENANFNALPWERALCTFNAAATYTGTLPTNKSPGTICWFIIVHASVTSLTIARDGSNTISYCGAALTSLVLTGGIGSQAGLLWDGTTWSVLKLRGRQRQEVVTYGAGGHGSTNTRIIYAASVETNTGTACGYAGSATNGDSYTIAENGEYHGFITFYNTAGAAACGWSKNSNQLTTNIAGITEAHRVGQSVSGAANTEDTVSVPIVCVVGDVVRVHGAGTANTVPEKVRFVKVFPE